VISILHISDLHFGEAGKEIFHDIDKLAVSISQAVNERWKSATERLIVVSGDLVYKGQTPYYRVAWKFLVRLCRELNVDPRRVVIVPGNHDITKDRDYPFVPVSRLIRELSLNTNRGFVRRRNVVVEFDETVFLMLNSAHHGDITYGNVDLSSGAMPDISGSLKMKVVVVHHNLIGSGAGDTSTIRNASELLAECERQGVHLVLHGHQHFRVEHKYGATICRIAGTGTLNLVELGKQNQFNLIQGSAGDLKIYRYIWVADLALAGEYGGWSEQP
jgi:3',5'-cyclic AMP phosphodiesterase CpdA